MLYIFRQLQCPERLKTQKKKAVVSPLYIGNPEMILGVNVHWGRSLKCSFRFQLHVPPASKPTGKAPQARTPVFIKTNCSFTCVCYWLLLAPIGSYWLLLAPIGSYWLPLASIGSYWLLLAPIGSSWLLSAPIDRPL